jgi:hypothetical protein
VIAMQDVLSPVVAAYVFDSVGGWLFANAGIASGAVLAAATAAIWWRSRRR